MLGKWVSDFWFVTSILAIPLRDPTIILLRSRGMHGEGTAAIKFQTIEFIVEGSELMTINRILIYAPGYLVIIDPSVDVLTIS